MRVSFGFILLIIGILGIARGGVNASQENLGQVIGTGPGVTSLVTLFAAFLLVGGLLILARTGKFSFQGSRGQTETGAGSTAPPLNATGVHAAK